MTAPVFIFVVGATLAAYLYLKHRIAIELQPFRLEMAAMGETLLANPQIGERDARLLEVQLSSAYSSLGPWVFVIVTPFAALRTVFVLLTSRHHNLGSSDSPRQLQRELNVLERRALISMMANSPVAAVIYILELVILMLLMIPLGRLRNETLRLVDKTSGSRLHSHELAGH